MIAKFIDAKTCIVSNSNGETRIEAEHVILANGSIPIELPFMPFDENVISSRDALELKELPKHLVVVGGGYIGLELGIAYKLLGSEFANEFWSMVIIINPGAIKLAKFMPFIVCTDLLKAKFLEKEKQIGLLTDCFYKTKLFVH